MHPPAATFVTNVHSDGVEGNIRGECREQQQGKGYQTLPTRMSFL
jgi:hypothetical protein